MEIKRAARSFQWRGKLKCEAAEEDGIVGLNWVTKNLALMPKYILLLFWLLKSETVIESKVLKVNPNLSSE
jgi:hypothetical protein